MTPGHCSRAVRAAMFAAVCVLLAATGHILVSGHSVPWWALSLAFLAIGATAWALADRERGLLAVTSATVAVQAALHCGFSLAQSVLPPSPPTGTPPGSAMPGAHAHHATHATHVMHETHDMHDMAGMTDIASTASSATTAAMPGAGHGLAGMSPTGMLAAHLLAAVLCGLWLAYGEQAAFRVVRALAGWIRTPLRVLFGLLAPAPHRPRVHVRRERRARTLRQLLLVHAITSRGPPTGTAVL